MTPISSASPAVALGALADALEAAADALRALSPESLRQPSEIPTADPDGKLLLTVTEAAEALSIGRSLTYQLVQSGDLPSLKLGRRLLIPVAGLRQLVAQATS